MREDAEAMRSVGFGIEPLYAAPPAGLLVPPLTREEADAVVALHGALVMSRGCRKMGMVAGNLTGCGDCCDCAAEKTLANDALHTGLAKLKGEA